MVGSTSQPTFGDENMDIIVLSIVAGLVAAGGIWMATRDTPSPKGKSSGHEDCVSEDSPL